MIITYDKSGYEYIILAGLIDAAIVIGFTIMLYNFLPETTVNMLNSKIDANFILLFIFIIYRLSNIILFSRTLGMLVFKLVFLNADEESMNFKEKALASFFILYRGVDYYRSRMVSNNH